MVSPAERKIRWLLTGVGAGCFLLLLLLEILTENDELAPLDLAVDALSILLTIGAAVGVALLAQRMQAQHEERTALLRDLDIARAEGNCWREKVRAHLAGLKDGLAQQFAAWGLTAAEREVGLLILKGLSHKEIASLRATTEATVRQQAQAIYRKASLPGKTAFSAYFLEDLFTPECAPDGDGRARRPARRAPPGHRPARGLLSRRPHQSTDVGPRRLRRMSDLLAGVSCAIADRSIGDGRPARQRQGAGLHKGASAMTRAIHGLLVSFAAAGGLMLGAAPGHGDTIALDEADILAELNDTDGDLGFHALIDGEAWDRLTVRDPDGRLVLSVRPRRSLATQGMTEIFFESAEPAFEDLAPEDFFARFPAGRYAISGRTSRATSSKAAPSSATACRPRRATSWSRACRSPKTATRSRRPSPRRS